MQNDNLKRLKKNVLLTLVYNRALSVPLTLIQVDRYLISKENLDNFTLAELREVLKFWQTKGLVKEINGLWVFSKNELDKNYLSEYIQKEKISQEKIKKVIKALKYFSRIPYLKSLNICGSVGRKVSNEKSDIDLLVLTKENRVWIVRFFLTTISFLLRSKTNDLKPRDNKFCLNHYRTNKSYLLGKDMQDIYSACEYSRMLNVYSTGDSFLESNIWIKNYLPNFNFSKPPLINTKSKFKKILENVLDAKLGDMLENVLKKLQVKKIRKGSEDLELQDNARLVTENNVIMFHLNPRAQSVENTFSKLLEGIKS